MNGERTFEYSADDKFVIGDTEPRFRGTVSTNLFYKGFSLYLLGRYECGAYLYNTTRATKVEGADPKKNADKRVFSSRWKNPGDIAFYKDTQILKDGGRTRNIQTVSWKKKMCSRWEP